MNKLYVKYMVSHRCKLKVKEELLRLGLQYVSIELGMAETSFAITPDERSHLKASLRKSGLELLDDQRSVLVEKIKTVIAELIEAPEDAVYKNYSEIISQKVGQEYSFLANVFSEVNGTTIQQYIIHSKIERAKELILYDGLTLSEIASRMNYSSVAHLSNQFKKTTGLTPTYYKQLKRKKFPILHTES